MPGSDQLKTVLKAFDVLELIGCSVDGMQLKYIKESLKQNITTLHTLLRTLVSRGYLIKLKNPIRYVIGPALSAIGRQDIDQHRFGQVGHIMQSICRQSGMRITYQKQLGYKVFVVLRVAPEKDLYVEQINWRSSAYGTSVIFQAYQTPQEQDRYWKQNPMDASARKLWKNHKNLRNYLKVAAGQRLAIIDTKSDQILRISAPVFNSEGKVIAAIAAVQFCSQITSEQAKLAAQLIHSAGHMLSETAEQISK